MRWMSAVFFHVSDPPPSLSQKITRAKWKEDAAPVQHFPSNHKGCISWSRLLSWRTACFCCPSCSPGRAYAAHVATKMCVLFEPRAVVTYLHCMYYRSDSLVVRKIWSSIQMNFRWNKINHTLLCIHLHTLGTARCRPRHGPGDSEDKLKVRRAIRALGGILGSRGTDLEKFWLQNMACRCRHRLIVIECDWYHWYFQEKNRKTNPENLWVLFDSDLMTGGEHTSNCDIPWLQVEVFVVFVEKKKAQRLQLALPHSQWWIRRASGCHQQFSRWRYAQLLSQQSHQQKIRMLTQSQRQIKIIIYIYTVSTTSSIFIAVHAAAGQ